MILHPICWEKEDVFFLVLPQQTEMIYKVLGSNISGAKP